jgi:hypothetical protein
MYVIKVIISTNVTDVLSFLVDKTTLDLLLRVVYSNYTPQFLEQVKYSQTGGVKVYKNTLEFI